MAHRQGLQAYSDPIDRFWYLYLLDADREDAKLADRWKGDADGILIFTGLFATIVGSFVIASYPNLQSNPSDQSAQTLLVIAQQIGQLTELLTSPSNISAAVPSPNVTALETFNATPATVRINILWTMSFFLSLFCGLLATLVQQWSRTYIGDVQKRSPPRVRGPIRAYLRTGVKRFRFNHAVDAIIALLHLSVFLFAAGFIIFVYELNSAVARACVGVVFAGSASYIAITVLPIIFPDCPFATPLTFVVRIVIKYPAIHACFTIQRLANRLTPFNRIRDRWDLWYHFCKRLSLPGRRHAFALCRTEHSFQRPIHVLKQMLSALDENDELFDFVSLLPYHLNSLRLLGYDIFNQLWTQFPHEMIFLPLIERLLRSFVDSLNPSQTLSPRKVERLTHLLFLANTAGVDRGDPYAITLNELSIPTSQMRIRARHHLTNISTGEWDYLVEEQTPVVSFLSHCLLSSLYVIGHADESTIDHSNPFDGSRRWLRMDPAWKLPEDNLVSALASCPAPFLSVYRLLLFVRTILHYATLSDSPVAAHVGVWLPVLQGLHELTMQLDLCYIPDDARTVVWRVFSLVGRQDLVPQLSKCEDGYSGSRQDYAAIFERHPVLGGTLRSFAQALATSRHRESSQNVARQELVGQAPPPGTRIFAVARRQSTLAGEKVNERISLARTISRASSRHLVYS